MPEATGEHATAKDLIAQIEGVPHDGEIFDGKVKALFEYVKHHVKEEHEEMFLEARATKLDMVALDAQIAARRAELLAQQ